MLILLLISQLLLANFALCEVSNFSQNKGSDNLCDSSSSYHLSSQQLRDNINEKNVNLTLNNGGYDNLDQLQRNQPILSRLDTKKDIYSQKQFNYSYTFFYEGDKTQYRESISNLGIMGITARLQSSVYSDLLIHHYDNFDELKQSGGPEVNQDLCLNELEYFLKRSQEIDKDIYRTNDVNFFRLLDSFGRRPSGLLMGNSIWLGAYDECLRSNILNSKNEKIKTRYCILNVRHNDWSQEDKVSKLIVLKTGTCLPKSCDSRNYKNKYELVEKLTHYALGSRDFIGTRVSSLYCLPDDQSSLRIWYHSPKAVITLALFACWISLLVYSTHKYDCFLRNRRREKLIKISTRDEASFEPAFETDREQQGETMIKIYRTLSVKVNIEKLFNTTNKSSLLNTQVEKKLNNFDKTTSKSVHINDEQTNFHAEEMSSQANNLRKVVDLSILEGIKVICMCYVILGHVLMSTTMIVSNGRDLASTTSLSFFTANLTPAFAVNSFFCITGILTTYLLFKTKQIQNITKKPISWLGLIIYRYFRILPPYLIAVVYLKNLSKYAGSGPVWDYGTSSMGQRRICEEESILWTVLFGANFKSPFEHCIPSAWYLANDFHFFLVTPIFLTALYKIERFGVKLLIYSTMIGYLAGVASIFMTPFDDLLPIANFMPHGLKTYVTFFEHNYTQPQYRIPAYLIGLLAGFMLYKYECRKLVFNKSSKGIVEIKQTNLEDNKQSAGEQLDEEEFVTKRREIGGIIFNDDHTDWSDKFKKNGLICSALCVTLCCITPLIAARLPFNKFFARLTVSIVMPLYHILFSIAVAIYILLSSTGHGSKLFTAILASPLWKPFARLSLSVVVTNIEVINYFIQTSKHTQHIDDQALSILNLSSIVATYLVATIFCTLFEAPLRGVANLAITHIMNKVINPPTNKMKPQ